MTTDTTTLQTKIEQYFTAGADAIGDPAAMNAFLELRTALSEGRVRAAEPDPASSLGWRVNAWVKQGILLGFRLGVLEDIQHQERRDTPGRQLLMVLALQHHQALRVW